MGPAFCFLRSNNLIMDARWDLSWSPPNEWSSWFCWCAEPPYFCQYVTSCGLNMLPIFLNLPTDHDSPEQFQNLGMLVPGAAHSEASTSNFPLGNIDPSYPPGSESDTPGLSASFLEDSDSVFIPVNTDTINEGTGSESVMLAPVIHTIIDFSLNATILHNVPGILHLIYLPTEANFIQRSLRIPTSNYTLPGWQQLYKFLVMFIWSYQACIELQPNINSIIGITISQFLACW